MSNSIRLSPKHGLNPTIPICFFCGEKKNEIALLGHLKGDAEAPRNAILDMEPCDKCKAFMDKGYTMLGVLDHPIIDGQPPIAEGKYLSRNFVVMSEQGIRRILTPDAAESVLNNKNRRFLSDDKIVCDLKAQIDRLQAENEADDDQ